MRGEREGLYVQAHQLRPAQPCGKANEQQRPIPGVPHRAAERTDDHREIFDDERPRLLGVLAYGHPPSPPADESKVVTPSRIAAKAFDSA